MTAPEAALREVLARIGGKLELARSRPLHGGVSAQVTAVEAVRPDGVAERLVIREYGLRDRQRDPHVAAHERDLLSRLRAAGLPVPVPVLADESGSILPGPYLVIEYVDGDALIDPARTGLPQAAVLAQLSIELARIHDAPVSVADLPWLADMTERATSRISTRSATADESLSEPVVRSALDRIWPPPPRAEPVLLHGDYWPGNTLWRDGALVSVIDWEDAAAGDPVADLANARMEICIAFGPAAATEFTRQYCALRPAVNVSALPHWDFYAALRHAGRMETWGLPDAELSRLRTGHRQFVAMITAGWV